MSIEKIIPSLADLTVFLQLLPLSASGQKAVSYVSLLTGVKRLASEEGPEEFHLVILDNGRSNMLANPHLRESLYCIRCGACLNSCPVYQKIGGHAYGWVYPGPIGAVLTPQLIGRQKAKDLPFASSLCGACYEVCPVKINIPQMLLHLRSEIKEGIDTSEHIAPDSNVSNQELSTLAWLKRGIRHTAEHSAFRAWARIMSSERSYRRYLGFSELVQRLDLTFESLHKLPRYRGHYLNWYDTQTLQPVAPHYISTVDSGNLAGHLIAVEQACLELADQPLFGARIIDGLSDVVALLAEANCSRMPVVREEINSCARLLTGGAPATAGLWLSLFASLEHRAAKIRSLIPKIERDDLDELCFWANALEQSAHSLRIELETFVPTIAPRTAELTQVIERCSKEAASSWRCLIGDLDRIPSASQLAGYCNLALSRLAALRVQLEHSEPYDPMDQERMLTGVNQLTRAFEVAAAQAGQLLSRLTHFAHTSKRLVDEMDLSFLYNEERNVFSIGYDISKDQTDDYFYDLLASEARLSSFVAIAKGSAPQQHWFRLGRGLTSTRNGLVLISWAATMFEYLMPLLVMRSYEKTLLDESNRVALARHIEYAQEQGIPWGMSESSCFARDINDNYQYGTFGVPGLGIKRGLSEDLVVTPYASLLAVMVVPTAALENLRRLEQEGALGRYGFYEAVDYTPGRLPLNSTHEIVRVFMAHHQGMSLLALDNLLNNNVMQRRFHASPLVRATELLLQERIPCGVAPVRLRPEEVWAKRRVVRRRTAAKRKPGTDRFHKQELYIPNGAQ
jgi:cyclic beta-1,2-glucan synthetase